MKVQILMASFLAIILTLCLSSCTKEEITAQEQEITTQEEEIVEPEIETLVLLLPEGVAPENSTEWYLQLTESEIEKHKIDRGNLAISRSCSTWSGWSGYHSYYTRLHCPARCPNYLAAEITYASRSRTRPCTNSSGGFYIDVQDETHIMSRSCNTSIYC